MKSTKISVMTYVCVVHKFLSIWKFLTTIESPENAISKYLAGIISSDSVTEHEITSLLIRSK